MLNGSKTWSFKEEGVIRLDRNDERMGTWMSNIMPKNRISAEELRTRLVKSMRECLPDIRL